MGKDQNSLPKNWPQGLPYLAQPSKAQHLSAAQLAALKARAPDITATVPQELRRGPIATVRITPITDPKHPAHPQCGLFAARHLPAGSLIVPYYGVIHSSLPPHSKDHESSDYDLWLDRDVGLAVDAAKAGNEARFVNDYRGVKDRPNAEFRECWDPQRGERCMAFFVLPAGKNATKKSAGGIAKGEEILVSYGKGFWSERLALADEDGSEEGPTDQESTEVAMEGKS